MYETHLPLIGHFCLSLLRFRKKDKHFKRNFVCFECYKNGKRNKKYCVKAITTKQKYAHCR